MTVNKLLIAISLVCFVIAGLGFGPAGLLAFGLAFFAAAHLV
jgi:hypothetical protein